MRFPTAPPILNPDRIGSMIDPMKRLCKRCLNRISIELFSSKTSGGRIYPMAVCKACDAKRKREIRRARKLANVCVRCGRPPYKSRLCEKCYAYERSRKKKKETQIRRIVLEHYGQKCACCQEIEQSFLTVDHINNDGNLHRKIPGQTRCGYQFYRWIIRNRFPKDLQLLCWNCNQSKRFNNGQCIHKTQQRLLA